MIGSARWARLRRDVLTAHPLCERCEEEGYVTAASEVHHERPVESGSTPQEREKLMFDRMNLRSLCHDCHVKAHVELGRSGRRLTRERNEAASSSFIRRWMGSDEPEPGGIF